VAKRVMMSVIAVMTMEVFVKRMTMLKKMMMSKQV
jgi:hypothetical protein